MQFIRCGGDRIIAAHDGSYDDDGGIGRRATPPSAYELPSFINDFLGMVRTACRSVQYVQVQSAPAVCRPT